MHRPTMYGALAALMLTTVFSTTAMADCRDEISAVEKILDNATRVREKRQASVERLIGRALKLYDQGKMIGCNRVAKRAKEVLMAAPSLQPTVKLSVAEVEAVVSGYKLKRQSPTGNSLVINFKPDKSLRAEVDLGPRGVVYRDGKWWTNTDSGFCYEMDGVWGRSEKSETCIRVEKSNDRVVFRTIRN